MCCFTQRPTSDKDGQIQQDDRPTSCNDGSQDFNFQQFSYIEEHEKKIETSFIKTSSSTIEKFETAFNLDRSLSEEDVEEEALDELRAGLESVDNNLKTQGLQDKTKNLKEEQAQLEKEKVAVQEKSVITYKLGMNTLIKEFFRSVVSSFPSRNGPLTARDQVEILRRNKKERKEKEKVLKESISEMFLMVLLFLQIKNIIGNIKCRQTSSRKYPCLNSILFLLWQSGDVEANPGPLAKSTIYRRWLYNVCSIVRKATVGVPTYSKTKNIWQQPPYNWPSEQQFFDPHNNNINVNEVENFLHILIQCCEYISILSDEILSEIDTWNSHKSRENCQLLNMYISRVYCRSAEKNVKLLISHLLAGEVLILEVDTGIQVILSGQSATDQQFSTCKMYRAEATRKIASFMCRILHGKDPEIKCNSIWILTPDGWPSRLRYYNPNNGGERRAENEDGMVVEALITLCEKKSIILPRQYQDMVEAWRADNQTLLSKLLTRHTAETDLKKAVMKLHEEGLLQDPDVDKQLREQGLLVQCDESTQNAKSQKRKIANTMNKHETKRTKQNDHEDAVDTTLTELSPGCSIGQLLDGQSDSLLLDKISQHIPDFLGDEADDVQFHWT